jgi:hypothetical protein
MFLMSMVLCIEILYVPWFYDLNACVHTVLRSDRAGDSRVGFFAASGGEHWKIAFPGADVIKLVSNLVLLKQTLFPLQL